MIRNRLLATASRAVVSSVVAFAVAAPSVALAQEEDEIVVLGSLIKRPNQANQPSPIQSIGAEDFDKIGAQSIVDVTQTLTINTGAQNNPDAFTQNSTTGTGSINLRGLGLQSTLVLVNGRRQVLNALQTNDGISFVDTNSLLPLIAIERQDILKDGASALYGSDAVAGVVNFVTVQDYDGIRVSGDFLRHLPEPQGEYRFEALVGKTFERGSVTAAVGWFDRTPLTTEERRLSVPFGANQDVSSLGNPGAFIVPALIPEIRDLETAIGLPPNGLPNFFIDPTGCAEFGGVAAGSPLPTASGFTPGVCQFDFGDFFNLVPDESRLNAYVNAKYDLTDSIEFSIDASYADINTERGNSPTFPFLQTAIVAPPTVNPDNPFGANTALFFGRAIGNGGTVSPSVGDSETYRFSAKLEGDNFLNNGYWSLSYTRAVNNSTFATEDTVTDRFQCALLGAQGTATPNPATGGATTCQNFIGLDAPTPVGQIYNPFATSFGASPNSPEILDFIIDTQVLDSRSTIDVVEGIAGTDLFELPGGTAAIAVGGQYRADFLERDFDDISNADGFGFVIGGQDFEGTVDVYAFFAEVNLPVTEWMEIQAAGRFEDFGDNGGTTIDPKIGVLIRPNESLSLRGTYSTSFRAPTTFQQFGESTTLNQVVDPTGGVAFAAVRAFGSQNLEPEQSRAFNAGVTWRPTDNLAIDVDYFNFSFEQAITQENFQALVNANPTDTRTFVGGLAQQPCETQFTIVCRAGDPNTGTITQVNTQFVNADSIDTSGLDFRGVYTLETANLGVFQPTFEATYILNYDLVDPSAGNIDGEGVRNFTNIGSPTPQLRFNAGLAWTMRQHTFNFFARRIGGFQDDQNGGIEIPAQTRFDLQYVFDIAEFIERDQAAAVTFGVNNLTNEAPPFVATNGGFESRVHDPRGRIIRFGVDLEF
ncbi:MAG: TonB-dependent receptor [Pseudomonadota bacterium]